jgi:hypothetical protein
MRVRKQAGNKGKLMGRFGLGEECDGAKGWVGIRRVEEVGENNLSVAY